MIIDACLALAIAAVAVCRLAAGAPARFRRSTHVVLAIVLLVEAGVLILPAARDSRNTALRLEETVLQMEEILQEYEKHNQEMVSNLASMLFKNTENIEKMSYNKARRPDGTENTELTITMKPPSVDQPPVDDDDDHTDEIMQAPKPNDDAPPAAAGSPSPPHGDATMGEHKQNPWRIFSIPQGHVFVLDCTDDELTLHVRPPSADLNDDELQQPAAAAFPVRLRFTPHAVRVAAREGARRAGAVATRRDVPEVGGGDAEGEGLAGGEGTGGAGTLLSFP
ncbi:hypothetical protein SEVIR_8G143800v4 [Setaria viridis]|uniref:Uncharacterized protein n=1 Tax=Setaria viridis TaxID=4556 RepID=A0A4U6TF94_SETVI|nr:uncharacterized protein LOC117866241 isoform X1 [Setaria viridis]TKW00910.1 hypothetical protein SEVIR_8G143800v2 [Setaria viridis]